MVLGGVPYLAVFEKIAALESALALDADAVRRLGALGVMVREDAERISQRLRLTNAESERLMALEPWWRVSPDLASKQHARCFIVSVRNRSPIACCLLGRTPTPLRPIPLGARLRPCRSAGLRRSSRSSPPTSSRRGVARVRRLAPPCAPRKRPGSRRIFRPVTTRSKRSPSVRRRKR